MLNELQSLFTRDLTHLAKEVELYPNDESLWSVAPEVTNSGGNLVLHLCGNLRHYIGFRLGQIDYLRDRPAEFSQRGLSRGELVAHIEMVRLAVSTTLSKLEPAHLAETYPEAVLDGPSKTGFFLLHLYGHLRYHTGQINYHRRLVAS